MCFEGFNLIMSSTAEVRITDVTVADKSTLLLRRVSNDALQYAFVR